MLHVRQASEALGTDGKAGFQRLSELASLLVGAALGYAGNVVVASAYTFANALITMIPFAIGFGLYAYVIGTNR